jgi:hypothetical protein
MPSKVCDSGMLPAPLRGHAAPARSRGFRANDQVYLAVKHLKKGQHLVDGFAGVPLIKEPV